MDKKSGMTIGAISRLSGLPAKTIRSYEEIGLVAAPSRTDAGYRQYSDADLHVLAFVRRARELGFSLNETAELLALWKDRSRSSAEIKSLLAVPVSDSLEVVPVMLAIVVTPRLPTERVCVRTMLIVKDDHHPPLSDRVLTQQRQQLPGRTTRFYSRSSGGRKRRKRKRS